MEQLIKDYLHQIEIEYDIEILLACETGSRAWGFHSLDSDYDVRFIYKHKKDWYLSLSDQKDSIDLMYDDNEIDLSGWDIRKSLMLLHKSNAALFERIYSPIHYISNKDFVDSIKQHTKITYSRIASFHHYKGMAKTAFADVKDEEQYSIKKLFYALRSAAVCRWIIQRDDVPPVKMNDVVAGIDISDTIKQRIQPLIEIKSQVNETYKHSGESDIIRFIQETLDLSESEAKSLPSVKTKLGELNNFFIETLNK